MIVIPNNFNIAVLIAIIVKKGISESKNTLLTAKYYLKLPRSLFN